MLLVNMMESYLSVKVGLFLFLLVDRVKLGLSGELLVLLMLMLLFVEMLVWSVMLFSEWVAFLVEIMEGKLIGKDRIVDELCCSGW